MGLSQKTVSAYYHNVKNKEEVRIETEEDLVGISMFAANINPKDFFINLLYLVFTLKTRKHSECGPNEQLKA